MGCQAAELNHFTKPVKMDLTLTNRHFNVDKFRVCIRLTFVYVRRVVLGLPGRSDLLDAGRLIRGFRCIHQASKPCLLQEFSTR